MEKITKLIEWIEGIPDPNNDFNNDLVHCQITVILAKAREIEAEDISFPTKAEMLKASITMDFGHSPSASVGYVWTPTRGEMIEVSDNGVQWGKREFIKMYKGYFQTYRPDIHTTFCWKYARPLTEGNCSEIPNSGIELPPEYPVDILSSESDRKIASLTKSLREVIEAVNKLNNK